MERLPGCLELERPRPARTSGQGTGAAHGRRCFAPGAVGGQLEAVSHPGRPWASRGATHPGASAGTEHPNRPAGLAPRGARLVLVVRGHGVPAVVAASVDALLSRGSPAQHQAAPRGDRHQPAHRAALRGSWSDPGGRGMCYRQSWSHADHSVAPLPGRPGPTRQPAPALSHRGTV